MRTVRRTLTWQPASGRGFERAEVTLGPEGLVAVGHVIGHDPDPFEVTYHIETDSGWRTRFVSVVEAQTGASVELRVSADGTWTDCEGRILHHLAAAVDVDISATPLSNTLPVRRLALEVGESADIVTAYVEVPGLRVVADPQRYTRLLPAVYRYESLDSDFQRDVVVDEDGFVLDYPGLFTRVAE